MTVSPLAGQLAPAAMLVNVARLVSVYYTEHPDPTVAAERVAFGTSGHRGSAFERSFNEGHILAITQAICSYRRTKRIAGPLFMGIDTHALSEPAFVTALEVLAANGVEVMIDRDRGYTPTPVISHAILRYNRGLYIRTGRRNRRHPLAQPAGRRRLQVQPAHRRAGGHRDHAVDRADRQCAPDGGPARRPPHARCTRAPDREHASS